MADKERESKVKSFRILKIDDMIRSGTYPNVPKLMKEFEASRSTIMRDIEFIRDQYQAPLEYDPDRRGYYYTDSTFFIKSVMLSEGELFTVSTIMPLLDQYKNTPLEASFKNILSKMMELLPDQVQVDSAFNTNGVTFIKDPLPEISETTFNSIFEATRIKKTVEFYYRSISSQDYSFRKFDPYNVLCQKGNWYIIGHCHKHNDIRVYALSRMKDIEITKDKFQIEKDFNVKKYIDPEFGIWLNSEQPKKIELLFNSNLNTYILERVWHVNQECKQNPDGSVYLSFMSNQLQETLHWVLSFGSSVKVLNPPELQNKLKEEIKKLGELY